MLNEKANDLGRLIGQSPEYQAVKRANESLQEDQALLSSLQRMDQLRTEAQGMLQHGQQPTAEMEQELDQLLTKVQGSMLYQRVLSANENFDKVMMQVNQWILEGIKKGATSSIITLG
ncbi:MAG: hypothetical protein RL625_1361 [Gemmatimonadota bacterium]|jgi:cell fate (sporulation/competence/biofilm development) regulator YlbF (YheA/YmcA/DUF963 family)